MTLTVQAYTVHSDLEIAAPVTIGKEFADDLDRIIK